MAQSGLGCFAQGFEMISESLLEEQVWVTFWNRTQEGSLSLSSLESVIPFPRVSEKLTNTAFSLDQGKFWSYLCK